MVNPLITCVTAEGVPGKGLFCLFRTVQIGPGHLAAGDPKLTRRTGRQQISVLVHHIKFQIAQSRTDGHIIIFAVDLGDGCHDGTFGRAVCIVEVIGRRIQGNQFFAAHGQMLQGGGSLQLSELTAHLGGNQCMGDLLFVIVFLELYQIQADAFINDMHTAAACEGGIGVGHVSIETVAGIHGTDRCFIDLIIPFCPVTEGCQVAVLKHDTLGKTGRAGGIQHDKQIFRLRRRQQITSIFHIRNFMGHDAQTTIIRINDGVQLRGSDQNAGCGILHQQIQAFRRIGGIQGQVSTAGFQNTQRTDHHIFTSGDQYADNMISSNTAPAQMHGEPVGDLIQLPVSICMIQIHQGGMLRVFGSLLTEQINNRLFCVKRMLRPVKIFDPTEGSFVCSADQADICLFQTFPNHIGIGRNHLFHKGGTEQITAVFHIVDELAVLEEHLHGHRLFCGVERKGNHLCMISADFFKQEIISLISKQGIGLDIIGTADLCKGITIVAHCTHQQVLQILEIRCRVTGCLCPDRQGLDQHGNGIGQTGIVSAVVDRGEYRLIRIIVLCQKDTEHAGKEYIFRNAVSAAEGAHCFRGDGAVLQAVSADTGFLAVNIRIESGITFTVAEFAAVECLCLGIGIALHGFFIIQGCFIARIVFLLKFFPCIGEVDILQQQGEGGSVGNDVMHIHEEVILFRSVVNLKPIQRPVVQVKGPHQGVLVQSFQNLYGSRERVIPLLTDLSLGIGSQLHFQIGMDLHSSFHCIFQSDKIHMRIQFKQRGNIVDRTAGIGGRIGKYADLGICKRIQLPDFIGLGTAALQHKPLQLNDGGIVLQIRGFDGNIKFPGNENIQTNGTDGGKSGLIDIRGDTEILMAHRIRNTFKQALLHIRLGGHRFHRHLHGFGKGALIDLLVLGHGDGIDLHGHRGNHVGRLFLQNERI